ncbi:hypothetical protein F443_13490 [Phytophthora nicotianae P1569]|uniref:Uncharacterized protein n=1 Tax=Phytophthora nicotianae P1569 TaxID=1317065 RepID=V9EQU4_PHYNI|nr:hypothetical protein F443_13490 [Phytophthora nicotianae P1569]
MVDDSVRNEFAPVYFVLCTFKTECIYGDVFHLINRDTGKNMTPADRALHRRMRNKRIMKEEASIAIEPGVPDILTVIDLGLVDPKGIAWVKHDINNDALLKGMCTYVSNGGASGFISEKRDSSDTSSRSGMFGIANPVVVRTNNPLEMFNRELTSEQYNAWASPKKQRAPRIQLPTAPDLTSFEIPPDSEDEYDDEVAYQVDGSSASVSSDDEDSSFFFFNFFENVESPGDAVSAEDLAHEIDEHADTNDFSLDWDVDQDNDE